MSNDDTDMPVHDRDSQFHTSVRSGTERSVSGTPDITIFRGKRTRAVNDDDDDMLAIPKWNKLNRDLDTDSSYMKGIDMTTTSKIPIIYNYDRSIHRSCTNLTNRLPHSLASILTFNYFLGDPITEFAVQASLPSDDTTPYSYGEELVSPEWPNWEIATKHELEACTWLKVWKKSQIPKNKAFIDTKWIFRKKHNPDGTTRYKA